MGRSYGTARRSGSRGLWGSPTGSAQGHRQDLLKQMRKLMQPLPSFLRPTQAAGAPIVVASQVNEREILGSPEFWFAGEGAGAKAPGCRH